MRRRLTFDVPGSPYSVAEANLVVLDHVEVPEVLPLRLNQHTTIGRVIIILYSHKHTQIAVIATAYVHTQQGKRVRPCYKTADENSGCMYVYYYNWRLSHGQAPHLHSMVRLSKSLANVASTARECTPNLKRTRRVWSYEPEKSYPPPPPPPSAGLGLWRALRLAAAGG